MLPHALLTYSLLFLEDSDEEIHLLVRGSMEQTWTKVSNVKLFQARNKDIVSFEIKEPKDR